MSIPFSKFISRQLANQ